MTLYKLKEKESCKLASIPAISLLKSLGVREGIKVKIKSKQPFGGPIVVQVGHRDIALAKDIAEKIVIEDISAAKKGFVDKQLLAEEVS